LDVQNVKKQEVNQGKEDEVIKADTHTRIRAMMLVKMYPIRQWWQVVNVVEVDEIWTILLIVIVIVIVIWVKANEAKGDVCINF
jgi:hypothetical protein